MRVPPGSPKFELKGAISAFFRSRSSIRRTSNEENTDLTPFIFEFKSLASPTWITSLILSEFDERKSNEAHYYGDSSLDNIGFGDSFFFDFGE